MIILDSPGGNQDEQSPLKKGMDITTPPAAVAIAPPPYAPAAVLPHPIPSYQAIPRPRHRATPPHRQSPMQRLLVAFAVACLVLLLWGIFMDSVRMVGRRPPPRGHYGHKLACFPGPPHIRAHHSRPPCKDCPPPCPPPAGFDHPIRILPFRYPPPIHPPKGPELSVPQP